MLGSITASTKAGAHCQKDPKKQLDSGQSARGYFTYVHTYMYVCLCIYIYAHIHIHLDRECQGGTARQTERKRERARRGKDYPFTIAPAKGRRERGERERERGSSFHALPKAPDSKWGGPRARRALTALYARRKKRVVFSRDLSLSLSLFLLLLELLRRIP